MYSFGSLVAIVIAYLILTYLIPLLPAPLQTIALILLVLAAIVWLVQQVS